MRTRGASALVLAFGLVSGAMVVAAPAAAPPPGVRQVDAGFGHTCILNAAGGVTCWGWNFDGRVEVPRLQIGVAALAAGGYHTCVLTDAGGVKCWGDNLSGQLGDGTQHGRDKPVDVIGLTSGVAAVAAGNQRSCALTDAGGVKCWGAGPTGDGTWSHRVKPVAVEGLRHGVAAISVGSYATCALTGAGAVKCWGENYAGQLGDGTRTDRLTPVPVIGLSSGVAAISAGGGHTCALTDAGGVMCWGYNGGGQLGDGTRHTRLRPVDVVGMSGGVAQVATGAGFTCARMTSDALRCWGSNTFGQLGDGTKISRSTPVDVVGLSSGVADVVAGSIHTCVLTDAGGVRCWGDNDGGQCGDGTTFTRLVPVTARGLRGADPGVYRPDALIARSAAGPWIGDGVYDPTGVTQRLAARVRPGDAVAFPVRLQNDGGTLDQLLLEGTQRARGFTVAYLHGATVITRDVAHRRWWVEATPGVAWPMWFRVQVARDVELGARFTVMLRVRSAHASGIADAVRVVVTTG